jgi:hypothetical protein
LFFGLRLRHGDYPQARRSILKNREQYNQVNCYIVVRRFDIDFADILSIELTYIAP